jgi:hypothetical protein
MSTAGDIINQALKDVGVIGSGEAASGDDVVDALDTLNQMIAQWQALPGCVPKAPYVLAAVEDLAAPLNLPPVYDAALRYSLGERLTTVFSVPVRGDIAMLALQARKVVKRSNLVIPDAEMPGALQFGRRLSTCCGDAPCA